MTRRVACALVAGVLTLTTVLPGWTRAEAGQWSVGVGTSTSGLAAATTVPAAPTATSSCGVVSLSVKVSWTAVARATTYKLYRSSSSATGPFTVAASGITDTSYTDSGLYVATFWYRVSAVSGTAWEGPQSATTVGRSLTAVLCT